MKQRSNSPTRLWATCLPAMLLAAAALIYVQSAPTQEAGDKMKKAPSLVLEEYHPKSMMVADYHVPQKAKFPAIDVHNHLGSYFPGKRPSDDPMPDPRAFVRQMDAAGVAQVVNLDGGWGETLKLNLEKFEKAYPGRFLMPT